MPPSSVHHGDSGEYHDDVDEQVKFYAPWCEHSKAIKAEYEEAALILRQVLIEEIKLVLIMIMMLTMLILSIMLMLMKLMLLIQEGSPIRLAEVDASREKVLAKREGVRSYFHCFHCCHCLKLLEN